ncbi:MAG: Jag N-terminal domain-containing protein [Proteobacteria bacterium]|nr:Jag N-terminal domain-containing protein [Pseudomonadota bacterium]
MSSAQEFEGKNLNLAIAKACGELNITVENLKYDIISYGSSGIFGLVGVKKAKIKVSLEPKSVNAEANLEITQESLPIAEEHASEKETVPDERLEDLADTGKASLEKILNFIVEDADIRFEVKERAIKYHVTSEKSALIIGKRGQTLEAIQYLLEKILNKNRTGKVRINVDIEGYLESRKDSLEEMAVKLADKAKKTGKPVSAGNMNAHDRKVIHLTLKNDRKVRTQSMGDGALKKLVIFPKKKTLPKKKVGNEETQ